MRIAVRSQADAPWRLVESAGCGNEAELQALLAGSPSLIPADEIRDGGPSWATSPLQASAVGPLSVRQAGCITLCGRRSLQRSGVQIRGWRKYRWIS